MMFDHIEDKKTDARKIRQKSVKLSFLLDQKIKNFADRKLLIIQLFFFVFHVFKSITHKLLTLTFLIFQKYDHTIYFNSIPNNLFCYQNTVYFDQDSCCIFFFHICYHTAKFRSFIYYISMRIHFLFLSLSIQIYIFILSFHNKICFSYTVFTANYTAISPQSAIRTDFIGFPPGVPTSSISFTTSIPSRTFPNTTCLPK